MAQANPQKCVNTFTTRYQLNTKLDKARELIAAKLVEVAHLTDDQKATVEAKEEKVVNEFAKLQTELDAKQKWEDPVYTLEKLTGLISTLQYETNAIFNTKPPEPKKPKTEEAKTEAPANEDQ